MERLLALILVTLTLVGQQSHAGGIEEHIYKGRGAGQQQFSYQALLYSYTNSKKNDKVVCGGSLISKNYVLTATRCVIHTDTTEVHLGLSKVNETQHSVNYTVKHSSVTQHSGYNSKTHENDIAVIKLPEMVSETNYIRPVALPKLATADPNFFNNYIVTVSGFGQTTNDETDLPHWILQYAVLYKMPQKDCKKALGSSKLTDGMICTDKKPKAEGGFCKGDFGDPLVVRYDSEFRVIGIASWFVLPCENTKPAVYTNVAHYLKWINQKTNIAIS